VELVGNISPYPTVVITVELVGKMSPYPTVVIPVELVGNISPYPTVVMVMTAHQKVAGILTNFVSGSSFSKKESLCYNYRTLFQ
jgi:hypothetical protein